MNIIGKFVLAAALPLMAAGAAHASVAIAISETTGVPVNNVKDTIGWIFWANDAISVDSLGIFDDSGDGLRDVVEVGLWDASASSGFALLALTTVPLGTSGTLINQFRYASIAPVTLTAGKQYLIGALYHSLSDGFVLYPSSIVSDPAISFYRGGTGFGGGAITPPVFLSPSDNIGPNFTFSAAVPEPTSWALMIAGFGLTGAAIRRRRGRSPGLIPSPASRREAEVA